MVIEFKSSAENGTVYVRYIRDGIEVAKYQTDDALAMVNRLMRRVHADPHMVFEVAVKITGAELTLSQN